MKKNNIKNKAFTLAEVLITLGVIGIVAAMTLPVLINKYEKQLLESQIKTTYTIINQALGQAIANGIEYDSFDTKNRNDQTIKEWYNLVFKPYLKISKLCLNVKPTGCWHQIYTIKNATTGGANGISNDEVQFILTNGASFTIKNYSAEWIDYVYGVKTKNSSSVLFFDANGKKQPNKLGIDVHILVWTDKGLVPALNDKTSKEINSNCTSSGHGCLKIIMGNNWIIPQNIWNYK